ncbi:BON domain-containing protein [Nitrospirillum sp. BR 11164]
MVAPRGRVRGWQEHDIAERAAWAPPGVTEVNNLIQVEP